MVRMPASPYLSYTLVKKAGLYTSFIWPSFRISIKSAAVTFRYIEMVGQFGGHEDTSAALTFPASSRASPVDLSSESALQGGSAGPKLHTMSGPGSNKRVNKILNILIGAPAQFLRRCDAFVRALPAVSPSAHSILSSTVRETFYRTESRDISLRPSPNSSPNRRCIAVACSDHD